MTFSAKILGTLAALGTSLIVARYYGTEMVGILAIINAILVMGMVFGLMGTDVAVLRLVPEYLQKYSLSSVIVLHKKMMVTVIAFSAIVCTGLVLSSSFICQVILHNEQTYIYVVLAAFLIVVKSLSALNMETLRGLQRIKIYAYMHTFQFIFNFILIAALTLLFYQENNPLHAFFVNIVVTSLILLFLVRYIISKVEIKNTLQHAVSFKEIISLSFPMFLTSSMLMVIYQSDTLMLGFFRNQSEVGIYAISLKLAALSNFVLNSVNSLSAPKFAQLYHAGDLEQLKIVAQKSTRLSFWATLPIILIYFIFGSEILGLFGREFMIGYPALLLLSAGQLVNVAAGAVGLLLDMTGHEKIFRNIVIGAGVLNIILNVILIPIYHLNGAAFASMVTVIIWNVVAAIYIKRKIGFSISYIPCWKGIFGKRDII